MAKNNCRVEFDELRTVDAVDETGEAVKIVVGRLGEVRFVDQNTDITLSTQSLPYGSTLFVADKTIVEKGTMIAKWDPFNAVIITETAGRVQLESVIEGVTYRVDSDESTGLREIIIIESKDKTKIPSAHILNEDGMVIRTYNLPVGGHVVIEDGQLLKAGEVLVKIPRAQGKAGDITGGLPKTQNKSNSNLTNQI